MADKKIVQEPPEKPITEKKQEYTFDGTTAGIKEDANVALHTFLTNNNIKLNIEVLSDSAPFVGDGFVLTDKPLLKIKAIYG